MNWDAVAAIAESVGAVGVIATLAYLAVQIRSNTKAVRVATYDSFVAQFRDWNAPFRADPELTTRFVQQLEDIESLDEAARRHAVHVFYDFFKLAEPPLSVPDGHDRPIPLEWVGEHIPAVPDGAGYDLVLGATSHLLRSRVCRVDRLTPCHEA